MARKFLFFVVITAVIYVALMTISVELGRMQESLEGATIVGFLGGVIFDIIVSKVEYLIRK